MAMHTADSGLHYWAKELLFLAGVSRLAASNKLDAVKLLACGSCSFHQLYSPHKQYPTPPPTTYASERKKGGGTGVSL